MAVNEATPNGAILVETAGGISTLTIDHGEHNLLNPALLADLEAELVAAASDPDITGIILTGARGYFCGGLDSGAILAGGDPATFAGGLVGLFDLLPSLSKPIAAAVAGDAVGGGAGLVGAVDFAAAVPAATIGTTEVAMGFWPMTSQVPVIKRIGARAAMENIGSGEAFSALRAAELGLVQVVSDDPVAACRDWLENAARAGKAAQHRSMVYDLEEMTYHDALQAALQKFVSQFSK